jgi:hypothetical protein
LGDEIYGADGGMHEAAAGRGLTRREFLLSSAGAGFLALGVAGWGPPGFGAGEAAAAVSDLDINQKGYPRAFFYRRTEGDAFHGNFTYDEWAKRFLPLNGIVGKVLNEAHDYAGQNNLPFFLRFKRENPGKMVLLHYNGTGRRVTDEALTKFFPGHWLHYQGTRLTAKVAASRAATVLPVQNTSIFRMGRYRGGLPDDIAITLVDAAGKPRWETAEQVRLKSIDATRKTITVTRGYYGTQLRSFPAGSYLAAHVTTGPNYFGETGRQNIPLWSYNYATVGPKDSRGRNGGAALVDYLVGKFRSGGQLASFDGIAFDVLYSIIRFGYPVAAIDTNGDGKADGGIVGGKNVVSLGTLAFTGALRKRLPGKIIMADINPPHETQRSFGHLTGVETEGFPDKYDIELDHLSTGANMFRYWKQKSVSPSMTHMTFAYKQNNPEVVRNTFMEPNLSQDQSYRKLRLVLAWAQFTDSNFTYRPRWEPPATLWRTFDTRVQVFDELWQGVDQIPNWLGLPLKPTVQLAARAPDLLQGQGKSWPGSFIARFDGQGISFTRSTAPGMTVQAASPRDWMVFRLPRIDAPSPDLFVSLRLRASPLSYYPAWVARRVHVSAKPTGSTGPVRREFTWAGDEAFTATFYFKNIGPGLLDLGFEVEGSRPITLLELTVHSATNIVYREFENGVVFANPSTRRYTLDLTKLFPGASFRRIQGHQIQDATINNGKPLGQTLTLPPKDGLFAVRNTG